MTKRVRYQVAVSLDGFIARPNGDYDWIVMDPGVDFAALYKQFDTAVMGRKTYEVGVAAGQSGAMPGMDVIVFSRTLPATAHPGVRIINDDPRKIVAELKEKKGRDIWLFGGGKLFRYLLDAGLVDTVEVAVMPVLLGEGIPLLPAGASTKLKLVDQKVLPKSGIVTLAYMVEGSGSTAPRIGYVRGKREEGRGKRGRPAGAKKSAKKRGKKAR